MVAKTTKAKPAAKTAPKTEKVTSRSAGYSKGEIAAPKPSKLVAAAAAKQAELDKAAKGTETKRAPNADKITNIANAKGADGARVLETEASQAGKEKPLALLPHQLTADVRKLAVLGGSLKAVRQYIATHKPDAKLAHGVTARVAPNAAKAASDQRKPAPAAPNPKAKVGAKGQTQTGAPKPAPKPNVTKEPGKRLSGQAYGGKVEDAMTITVVAGSSPYKSGSKADATFGLFGKAKTVADFRKLVAKSPDKYDAGYIRYAARDGFIVLK